MNRRRIPHEVLEPAYRKDGEPYAKSIEVLPSEVRENDVAPTVGTVMRVETLSEHTVRLHGRLVMKDFDAHQKINVTRRNWS